MTAKIYEEWLSDPPRTIVVGKRAYASSLAFVLGAPLINASVLFAEPEVSDEGGFPLVLRELERVVFVSDTNETAADLLRWHEAGWRWIEKLSPDGEQHEVSILFVLPNGGDRNLPDALALGLGLEKIDPTTPGHGIARMGDSLGTLCATLAAIHPSDLPPLRARKAGDIRHAALRSLQNANTPENLTAAAQSVAECFHGHEYHLDLFCQQPSHRNGNQLRQWLREVVTGGVAPDKLEDIKSNLANWLQNG
jgi:hypothetical protein